MKYNLNISYFIMRVEISNLIDFISDKKSCHHTVSRLFSFNIILHCIAIDKKMHIQSNKSTYLKP